MTQVESGLVDNLAHFAWLARGTRSGYHAFRNTSQPLMTPVNASGGDNKRRRRTLDESKAGYRWTCPFCGTSRLNITTGEDGEGNAIAALRAHIYASAGDGHGPHNAFPSEFLALSEHVIEVEGRR